MKQQTQTNKIEWKDLSNGKIKFISYEFVFKNGKRKRKKIKFNKNPKKLQGGSGGPQGIKIDRLFFEFNFNEQVALLWHELFHCRSMFLPKMLWLEIKYDFGDKKSFWKEEFEADEYSALQNNIQDCLSYLRIIKKIYQENSSLYNAKTHPPIDERIKAVEKLEAKKGEIKLVRRK